MYSAVDIQNALVDVLEALYEIPRSGWRAGGWEINHVRLYGDIYGGRFAVGTVDVDRVSEALTARLGYDGNVVMAEEHPDDTRIRIKYAIDLETSETVKASKQASKQADESE